MIQSFYTASNGLHSQQINIDTIAANVSNVGTTGYKYQRLDFKDALYTRMRNPVDNGEHMNLQLGTGALPLQVNRIFMQGAAISTDRPLDFMIQGRGFFTVRGFDEEGYEIPLYTRDGAFYLTPDPDRVDGAGWLVDGAGRFVLDDNGDIILIHGNPSEMTVGTDGRLYFEDEYGEPMEVRLGIVDFINPGGLLTMGENVYMETENSGEAEEMEDPHIINGALEASNVDLALETTRLIRAQRAYQFASRALNVADQMAGLANSIRQ
jgi:flagellar basal-body rod protein FlgG